MRPRLLLITTLMLIPTLVRAADTPAPEQLKKMYDDALVQLKSTQDRKNELAKENENLKARVEELSKQLAAAQVQEQDLKREVAENADKTFYLRSYHAAWESFIRRYPDVLARWKVFIENDVRGTSDPDMPALIDPRWPILGQSEG